MKGYFVTPANAKGKLPGVLVVHENRGLNPHIEDIARRLALDNFVAFAPDALTPLGGYPGDEDKARELFPKLDQAKTREDFVAAAAFLKARPECTGRIGAVGFCYGGGIVNMLATRLPDLAAGVPFYGRQPAAADVPKIKAPLLIQYAENDQGVNAGWPEFEAALKANNVKYHGLYLPGHAARVQQRYDAEVRRSRRQVGLATDRGLLQSESAEIVTESGRGRRQRVHHEEPKRNEDARRTGRGTRDALLKKTEIDHELSHLAQEAAADGQHRCPRVVHANRVGANTAGVHSHAVRRQEHAEDLPRLLGDGR